MEKKVIGLVAPIKAGKGEAARYLAQHYNASVFRFSQVLGWILDILCLPQSRKNLQNLAIALRKEFGSGVLVLALEEKIKREESSLVVVDGIRVWEEAEMVKGLNGILVYIVASDRIRYDRLQKPEKVGEELLTFEQFLESEKKETELLIHQIGQTADFVVDNEGTRDQLYAKIDEVIDTIRG
jgi:dephospho-CoA kinase